MKDFVKQVEQFVILVLATLLALYLFSNFMPTILEQYLEKRVDMKVVITILAAFLYIVLTIVKGALLKFPPFRRLVNSNYAFSGTYLSFPADDPDALHIFTVKSDFLNRKYRLEGRAYSLSTENATGSWSSDLLDMSPSPPVQLTYLYIGNAARKRSRKLFQGLGYGKIAFNAPDLKDGEGYFVEDTDNPRRESAGYLKLTKELRQEIGCGRFSCSNSLIVKWFKGLATARQAAYRGTTPPLAPA